MDREILKRNDSNYEKIIYHPNSLRLYVRGKLAVDNLMAYLRNTQAFSNYIEGEISFDVLDDDSFEEEWLYQYTIIDEATRERFIYPYKEHCGFSTVDFLKRAIVYFGYIPETIQTDNGTEFTNPRGTGKGKIHIVDKFMNKKNRLKSFTKQVLKKSRCNS